MDLQLEFLVYTSLPTTHPDYRRWLSTSRYNTPYTMSYNEYIASTKNAGELALVFHAHYERSGDTLSSMHDTRVKWANEWYDYFSNR